MVGGGGGEAREEAMEERDQDRLSFFGSGTRSGVGCLRWRERDLPRLELRRRDLSSGERERKSEYDRERDREREGRARE